ncbi:MAG: hypothetical protein WC967_14695 [Balneolaceae bacterium]
MLTLDEIIEQIKDANYPYYKLRGRKDIYSSTTIQIGDNLTEKDPTVEQVIEKVKRHVGIMTKGNPHFIFELELLRTPSSNQTGKIGAFLFVNERTEGQPEPSVPDQNKIHQPTIMGLGAIQEQTQALMQMNNQMLEPRLALERERTLLEVEKVNLNRDREQFEREKKELMEKLKKDEEVFNSHTERAKKGVEKGLLGLYDAFVNKDEKGGLAGAKTSVEESEELTEEQELINSIAQNMNEHYLAGSIGKDEILKVGAGVQTLINKYKKEEA